jgi:hypothetical protein
VPACPCPSPPLSAPTAAVGGAAGDVGDGGRRSWRTGWWSGHPALRERAEAYLLEVAERARLQGPPELVLIDRPFASALEQAPTSTRLHVFALSSQTDVEWLREIRERLEAPCVVVRDSGVENAFA